MTGAIFPFFRLSQMLGDFVYVQLWDHDIMYEVYYSDFPFLMRRASAITDHTSLLLLSIPANK